MVPNTSQVSCTEIHKNIKENVNGHYKILIKNEKNDLL